MQLGVWEQDHLVYLFIIIPGSLPDVLTGARIAVGTGGCPLSERSS